MLSTASRNCGDAHCGRDYCQTKRDDMDNTQIQIGNIPHEWESRLYGPKQTKHLLDIAEDVASSTELESRDFEINSRIPDEGSEVFP